MDGKIVYYYYRMGWMEEFDGKLFSFPEREAECEFLKSLELPEGWKTVASPTWCHVLPPEDRLPVQGWKIHVSAIPKNVEEILKIVSDEMFSRGLSFKFLANKRVFFRSISKNAPRGSSGKFITIYPPDVESFKEVIEALYQKLKSFEGPYVLSDKRYKDCKVLYYRYGGFISKDKLEPSGTKVPMLIAPDGSLVPDIRTPYFNPPPWAEDPFPDEDEEEDDSEEIVLNGRYKVVDVFKYSNMGGLYVAEDLKTGKRVVLKEARPYTFFVDEERYSFHVLEREYEILSHLHKHGIKDVPRPIEMFQEWEHRYLVTDFVEGESIDAIVSTVANLISKKSENNQRFISIFSRFITEITSLLKSLHERGVVHGDLSVNNVNVVLKDQVLEKVKLIDFEGASVFDEQLVETFKKKGLPIHMGMFTPGFIPDENKLERTVEDDLYGLGALILHTLVGAILDIKYLNPKFYKIIHKLSGLLGFPKEIANLIDRLLSGEATYEDVFSTVQSIDGSSWEKTAEREILSKDDAQSMLRELLKFTNNVKFINDEIPYPLSSFAYNTNTLSLGFGVGGILWTLRYITGEIDRDVFEWFKERTDRVSVDDYPPGIMTGLAGLSWVLWDLGEYERSLKLLQMANEHPILFDAPSLFFGSAGVSYANLRMFLETKEERFMTKALEIAEKLANTYKRSKEGIFWNEGIGLANGPTGIALLFLYLYILTGDKKWVSLGFDGLKRDISFEKYDVGLPPTTESNVYTIYLEFGTAGVAKVAYRYIQFLQKDPEFHGSENIKILKDYLRSVEPYLVQPWVSSFTYLFGAAGMADAFMDMEHPYAGGYLSIIKDMMFETPYGYAVPSENTSKIYLSFGNGIAGIMAVLNRYIKGEEIGLDLWKKVKMQVVN